MATLLVTGMAGSLARLTALELVRRGDAVVGVDYRPAPDDLPGAITYYRANYNKTRIEDVFRRHRPDAVLHLGRVGNLKVDREKRFDLNVVGSAKIMELSVKYGVRRLVVLSTFHIYGAHPHNHVPIAEDEPVRALQTIPRLADAIQLDTQAVTWAWRHPELQTVVLRPANVVGPHVSNTVSRLLRLPRIPFLLGFNPMWQVVHETDMLRALLLALDAEDRSGVYNVAGRGELPYQRVLALTGARRIPVPAALLGAFLRLDPAIAPAVPDYLVDFMKYPVIVSDERFREAFGYVPRVAADAAVRSCVSRAPTEAVLA